MNSSEIERAAADVEALLTELLADGPSPRLLAAMRYAALGGGKRLRPFLVLETAGLFGVPGDQALRVGAALEMIHCYSLAHDDLPAMDNDDLRRGKPTVHRAFDEATAILAGDALHSLAFAVVADPATHPDGAVRARLCTLLGQAALAMAHGQMLDLEAEKESAEAILAMQALKTGALFRFACEAGAVLGGGDPAPLIAYGDALGRAFQVADDILDVTSEASVAGKAVAKDAGAGKATLVGFLGLDAARARAAALAEEAAAAVAGLGGRAERLQALARFVVSRRS